MTVKQATIELLRHFQMTTIFGNPGSTELAFLDDLPTDLRYVLALQEASAVGIADGFAQATGRAAFVNLHSAAGLGNALGNIFTAFKNETPLVITAGQQVRSMLPLDPYLGATCATEFPRPYVKWACEPARAEDVPVALSQGYYMAMQRPRGPVFISVPSDDWERATTPVIPRQLSTDFTPDKNEVLALAEALKNSLRPAFVYGAAIDREGAFDLGVQLAERAQAHVWMAPVASRSSFPQTHPLFAGFLPAIPEKLSSLLKDYDLILVIGAPVFTFHVPGVCSLFESEIEIFQITDDASSAARAPKTSTVFGTMKPTLQALLEALEPGTRIARDLPERCITQATEGDPLPIDFVMQILSEEIPDDTAIVEEAPSHEPAMQRHFPIRQQQSFYTMASGGLGYGLPAAVGVAMGQKRRVVCLLGDGAAMYSVQALWTAVQQRVPLIVVVLNNGNYGAMKSFSKLLNAKNPPPGTELPGIQFQEIAAGFGMPSFAVRSAASLRTVMGQVLKATLPALVEVAIDPSSGGAF